MEPQQRSSPHYIVSKIIGVIMLIGGLFFGLVMSVILATNTVGGSVEGSFRATSCVLHGSRSSSPFGCSGEFTPNDITQQSISLSNVDTLKPLEIGVAYPAYALLIYGKTRVDQGAVVYIKGDTFSRASNIFTNVILIFISIVLVRIGWMLIRRGHVKRSPPAIK